MLTAGLVFLTSSLSLLAKDDALAPAWDQATSYLFNDAVESFQKAPVTANPRERDFGVAVSMLNFQPQTDSNIEDSLKTFERLAAENPSDRIGILSRYFTGRIPQIHLPQPDFPKALAVYYDLIRARTGDPVAESSAAHIVVLETYGNDAVADPIAKLIELESLSQYLTTRAGRRGFHFAIGYAFLNYSDRDDVENLKRGISHLKLVDQERLPRWQDEANLVMAIAEASLLSGDKPAAIEYYGRFAQKFKRDSRNYYARQQLKALTEGAKP